VGEIVIVGVGNPFRGDDGVGWAVVDALDGKVQPNVVIAKRHEDFAVLSDYFAHYATVYIVDAAQSGGLPGSWQRLDGLRQPLLHERPQTSTHGFGVMQAIELARELHSLPARLIIYAVEAETFQVNDALSVAVARAVPMVASEIIREIGE
jgi:hydrogenase maturation protease